MTLKILISNDDGYQSPGIDAIAKQAKNLGEITIIAPNSQRSAGGKSLTFHKPIFVKQKYTKSKLPVLTISANPADSLIIYTHIKQAEPDLVISGINAGENSSIHSILTSGTCAVALEAGLRKIPAFAISHDVDETMFFEENINYDYTTIAKQAITIIKKLLALPKDYWEQILFININFPREINEQTTIKVVPPSDYKYHNYLIEQTNPRNEVYYWMWGKLRKDIPNNTDTDIVLNKQGIAVTPIAITYKQDIYQTTKQALQDN